MPEFLKKSPEPLLATIAGWGPKKNTEDETRIRIDFELPLTDDTLAFCPKAVQAIAKSIAVYENGLTEAKISLDFVQTIEIFTTPGHTEPSQTLSAVALTGLHAFRPLEQKGSARELYLTFSVTTRAEGPYGESLAGWLLRNLKSQVFIRTHEVQGTLPGMGEEAAEKPAKAAKAAKSGKDAAAGKDE